MRYIKPYYLPSYTTITPFHDEFKNLSNVWYKVKYWIDRDRYTPRLTIDNRPSLGNIFDCNGNDVFARATFDRSMYKLIAEDKEDKGIFFEITETYGYQPSDTFTKYSSASVQFAGHTVYGDGTAIAVVMPTLDATGTAISFPYLYKGDSAYMKRPATGGANWNLTSDVFVLDRDGHAPNPSWTRDSTGESESTRTVINTGVAPSLYLYKRTIPPRTQTVNVKTLTQFFYISPDIIPHTSLVDSLGNEVWDATDATVTNLYNNMYCIDDSEISKDNAIGLWRRDIKLTRWKVF